MRVRNYKLKLRPAECDNSHSPLVYHLTGPLIISFTSPWLATCLLTLQISREQQQYSGLSDFAYLSCYISDSRTKGRCTALTTVYKCTWCSTETCLVSFQLKCDRAGGQWWAGDWYDQLVNEMYQMRVRFVATFCSPTFNLVSHFNAIFFWVDFWQSIACKPETLRRVPLSNIRCYNRPDCWAACYPKLFEIVHGNRDLDIVCGVQTPNHSP